MKVLGQIIFTAILGILVLGLTGLYQEVDAVQPFDDPVTIENTAAFGGLGELAIGDDGFPVMSYRDGSFLDLKFVHCTNVDCSTFDTPITLDSVGDVGIFSDLAIGNDGFPIISYGDSNTKNLNLIHCTNVDCSTFDSPIVLDTSLGLTGGDSSIDLGNDLYPVIAYHDDLNDDLKFVHCTTLDCSIFDTPVTLDSVGDVGHMPSLVVGSDAYPVISYLDFDTHDLKLIKCTTLDCSIFNAPITLDSVDDFGGSPSIAIGSDLFPVMSYVNNLTDDLKLIHCTAGDCSTFDSPITLDTALGLTGTTSLTIGNDGFPLISYHGNANLKLVHCTSIDCSTFDTPVTLAADEGGGATGTQSSISIGNNGLPVIGYHNSFDGNIQVLHCNVSECLFTVTNLSNWLDTVIAENSALESDLITCNADLTTANTNFDKCTAEWTVLNDDLNNLFLNNQCVPMATSISNVLICIVDLNDRVNKLEILLEQYGPFTKQECDDIQAAVEQKIADGKKVSNKLLSDLEICIDIYG